MGAGTVSQHTVSLWLLRSVNTRHTYPYLCVFLLQQSDSSQRERQGHIPRNNYFIPLNLSSSPFSSQTKLFDGIHLRDQYLALTCQNREIVINTTRGK